MDKKILTIFAVVMSITLLASYGIPLLTQGADLVSLAYAEEKIAQDTRICGIPSLLPTDILKGLSPWTMAPSSEVAVFNVRQIAIKEDEVMFKKLNLVLKLYTEYPINASNPTVFEKRHSGWLTVLVDNFRYHHDTEENRIYLSITNATIILQTLERDNNLFVAANLSEFKSEIGCNRLGSRDD